MKIPTPMSLATRVMFAVWLLLTARQTIAGPLPMEEKSPNKVAFTTVTGVTRCTVHPCQKPKAPHEVRHVVMLSGPRHGTSFVMSLMTDSNGTAYLGELLNSKSPLAHANVVNPKVTLQALKVLDNFLPKLTSGNDSNPTKSEPVLKDIELTRKLQASLGPRIAKNQAQARQVLETWAFANGWHTLLYKLFGDFSYVKELKSERCAHFLHLRRNFLQVYISKLEVASKEVLCVYFLNFLAFQCASCNQCFVAYCRAQLLVQEK
mmetsp:Transcript_30454/g.68288  ORF Transcript_30454/g.68288 Transcript_30454/m.68288 type:complete len:263 (+) Transcript_30454:157-945(+)